MCIHPGKFIEEYDFLSFSASNSNLLFAESGIKNVVTASNKTNGILLLCVHYHFFVGEQRGPDGIGVALGTPDAYV